MARCIDSRVCGCDMSIVDEVEVRDKTFSWILQKSRIYGESGYMKSILLTLSYT